MSNPLFFEIPLGSVDSDDGEDTNTDAPASLVDFIDDDEVIVDAPARAAVNKRKRDAADDADADDDRLEAGTPEPELVEIVSGKNKGKKRRKTQPSFRSTTVFMTFSHLLRKPTVDEILEQMSQWKYKLRQWEACFERHQATRTLDEEGNVVAEEEGTFHIHLVGYVCLNARGDAPNIKNFRCWDIKLDRETYHPNFKVVNNMSDVW